MEAKNLKRGAISILLAFGLVFSIISVVPFAHSGDLISDPGGTTIEVAQGDNFLIRHTLEWNEPEDGAYTVTLAWDCYDNEPSENFTFVGASAYFTTGDYVGQSIQADIMLDSAPSPDYPGSTRYALSVNCPSDNKDSRNGQFNVDVTLGAYGAGGVPHIATDNHPTPYQFAGVIIIEPGLQMWNRDPITIRVLGRGVNVSISPPENSALPGQSAAFTVTVTNTGGLDENYDLTVSDNAGWGPTLSENALEIPAGENQQVTLSVTVPADALGCTGDNVIVTATSRDNTIGDNDSCIAHAEVVRSVEVSISPGYQENLPGGNLTYDITIRNTGNVADTYSLENSDDAGWPLSLGNASFTIQPSDDRTTKLTVAIPGGATPCTNNNITVTATSQENAEVGAQDSCIAHVRVVRGVEVSISPDYQSGVPCTTLDYTVTVKNTGNVEDTYDLVKSDNAGWGDDVTLENDWLVIQPNENQTTTLHVHIPDGAIACTEDNIIITATSSENAEVEDSASCMAHVAVIRGVNVSISPSEDSGVAGTTLTYTVTVTNTGNVLDTYDLEAIDNVAPSWNPTLEDNLEIPAGESRQTTLSVTIPENAEPCTRDNITVTATSQENAEVEDDASCIAHVSFPRGVEVSISPGYQEGVPGVTLDYTVTVKNTGALDDNYDLVASDDAGWSLIISPTSLTVPMGETRDATLSVTIPEIASGCTRDNITVTATSQADNGVSAENLCIAHAVGLMAENTAVIYPTADVYAFGKFGEGYSRSQLKFDLSSIPSGAGIISAKLWMYRLAADNWDGNATLNRVENQAWDETITASEFDAQTLTDENNHAGKFTSHGWDYLNVLTQLKVDYDAANTYASFRLGWANDNENESSIGVDDGRFLLINGEAEELFIFFSSSEYGGNDPYLEVVYVPPYAVSVRISPSYRSGLAGEELSYTVMVTNMGNLDDNYVLTVSDNAGWGPISPISIAVASGSTGDAVLSVIVPENVPPCTRDNIVVTATSTENLAVSASASCLAHRVKAEFSLATLYKVSLDLDIYLSEGSKLVAKFYTWWGAFQAENVVWSGTTPEHVVLLDDIPHPQGRAAVQKVVLVLTDAEGTTISTVSTFIVTKVTLEVRYMEIPLEWALATTPEEKVGLEIEYMEIPLWWALAPE